MISESVTSELHLVNLLIGLCRNLKSWPNTLSQLGYDVFRIELPLTNSTGQQVRPDVVLHCKSREHVLVVECKSGKYVKDSQVDNYPNVTARDLLTKALVPISPGATLGRDIMVFCLSSRFSQIQLNLKKAGWSEPVVGLGEESIHLLMNQSADPPLNEVLQAGIPLGNRPRPPLHFLPFSANGSISSDADVALQVMTSFVSLSRQGHKQITLTALVLKMFGDTWPFISTDEQQRYRNRVRDIIKEAITNELKHLIIPVKDQADYTWAISFTKFKSDVATFRHLAGRLEKLVNRLRMGAKYEPSGHIQMDLDDWLGEQARRQNRESHRATRSLTKGT